MTPPPPTTPIDYSRLEGNVHAVLEKQIFFVVGTMKSGTTWLEKILDAHPDVSCRGEGHFTDILARLLKRSFDSYNRQIGAYNERVLDGVTTYPELRPDHLYFVLKSAIALLLFAQCEGREVAAVGEKTPNHTRDMALLRRLFPEARFVHVVRDGRDVAVSAWFHYNRVNPGWTDRFGSFAGFAEEFATMWVRDQEQARAFIRRFPDQCKVVRYERLQGDTEAAIREVLDFLGVASAPDLVARCRAAGDFAALAGGRSPGDEDPASLLRKGVVGDWRNHFDGEALKRFNGKAGHLMAALGYR